MELDTYQAETAALAARQGLIFLEAKAKLKEHGELSTLEFSVASHALQVLTEKAIGKAKYSLKAMQYGCDSQCLRCIRHVMPTRADYKFGIASMAASHRPAKKDCA